MWGEGWGSGAYYWKDALGPGELNGGGQQDEWGQKEGGGASPGQEQLWKKGLVGAACRYPPKSGV